MVLGELTNKGKGTEWLVVRALDRNEYWVIFNPMFRDTPNGGPVDAKERVAHFPESEIVLSIGVLSRLFENEVSSSILCTNGFHLYYAGRVGESIATQKK